MPRITLALAAVAAVLAVALLALNLRTQAVIMDDGAVRTIVEQVLAERAEEDAVLAKQMQLAQAEAVAIDQDLINQDLINPMIENYLMADPKILQRVSAALQEQLRLEEIEKTSIALASYQSELYDDPEHVVLGNPDGDVTLVEFFDYNCGFCRRAMPDMARLLEEDPNLRVILKEFPILSNSSVEAARISVVVANAAPDQYQAFHEILFTGRGQVSGETALAAVEQIGLDPANIAQEAGAQSVTDVIKRSYVLAEGLSITGTPSYVIGDEVFSGAVGYEALKTRIDNMRECGSTVCDSQTATGTGAS